MLDLGQGSDLSYNLVMEVKKIDDYHNVVIFTPWLHLANQATIGFVLRLGDTLLYIPPDSIRDSVVSNEVMDISIASEKPEDEWQFLPLCIVFDFFLTFFFGGVDGLFFFRRKSGLSR